MTTYKIGGSLPANAPTYVVRQADRDLVKYLNTGEFCYILNSRQMGKSSLKLRAIQQLEAEGVACAEIDLAGIGTAGVSEKQWHNSIADELATQFGLESELAIFWDSHPELSAIDRLTKFIDTVLLEQIASRIVIFVDEIDLVISLDAFTDDFFRLIRSCSERGAARTKYQRLSFVLVGVAAPTDLIKNRQSTPFNIGRAIDLHGFELTDDLTPLVDGLVGIVANPIATIAEILYWTGGQPFLTQKVCQLVVEYPQDSIEDIIQSQIIDNWEDRDNPVHLKTIANRILSSATEASYLLEQYRQIISSTSTLDRDRSSAQQQLKLSGLVVEREGRLQVYNPIYARVFNIDWIDRELAKICPHAPALLAWIDTGRPRKLLLRGHTLAEALEWRDSHPQLSGDHYDFLIQGQKATTDRALKKIQTKIKQLIKILACLMISGIFLLLAISNVHTVNRFDRASSQIIGQYEFAPLDALKAAIVNAHQFQDIRSTLLGNSTPTPKLALQKLVDSIQETDEINTYQQGINAINFCQDDRIFIAGNDGTIELWDRHTNGQKSREIVNLGAEVRINSVSHPSSQCRDIFATASSDGKIRLWQDRHSNTAKLIAQTLAHQANDRDRDGGVQNVRLTEDGRYLFSTGKTDGRLKRWRVDGDRLILVSNGVEKVAHKDGIMSLNLNGKKDRIGTAGKDHTAKIWDLDGNLVNTLTGHHGSVNSVYFCSTVSENCPIYEIATASDDGTVRLWQANGKHIKTIYAHTGEVRAVRFSPDGQLLASASAKDPTVSNGSSIRIWNLEDSKLVAEFKGHQGAIESMRFKPKSTQPNLQQLATSGQDDSTIRVWKLPAVMPTKAKHQDKINSIRADPYDSNYFITAGEDGTIRWWNRQLGGLPQLQDTFDRHHNHIKFNTIRIHPVIGHKIIAVGDSVGMMRLLKIDNDKIIEVSSFDTQQGNVESIDWSYHADRDRPDRYLLATTGSVGADIKIWEIDVAKHKLSQPQPIYQKNWNYSNLSLRFSEDSDNLAVGAEKGQVVLIKNINSSPLKPIEHLVSLSKEVGGKVTIGFSKDNQSLTIVSKEGKIWRSTMEPKLIDDRPIETYQAGTENITVSGDGSIATGGAGAALRLWDLQGRQIGDFRGYWGTIRSINFSRDGRYLLAGGDDGIPMVWQIDRDLPNLIDRGCRWLKQGYIQSHSVDPDLQAACQS